MRPWLQTAIDHSKPERLLLPETVIGGHLPWQAWRLVDLPLHKLLGAARRVERAPTMRDVRIAVLGDAATQHYCQALAAVLKLRGYWPLIYEAEFDMIRQQVLDPQSALYAHRPEAVILFHTVQSLAPHFFSAADKRAFIQEVAADLEATWTQLLARGTTVLQHLFVVPIERPLGNQTATHAESFARAVTTLNTIIVERAHQLGIRLIDTEWQASYFGKRVWFDERLWCQARQALSPTFLPSLAKMTSDVLLLGLGSMVKCVVVDLDNTMWGGVLGDDGPDGIELGQTEVGLAFLRVQESLSELRRRGVLLAICSRNHEDAVREVLDGHPDMLLRSSDFVAIVANHGDKVTNLLAIKERLNIGLDSMVFLDDSPFEREMVRRALPDVCVPDLPEDPSSVLDALARWGLFEGLPATAEDRVRARYYTEEAARAEQRRRFEGLEQFLEDLNMEGEVVPFDAYTKPRVLQLVQRSNQFNLTTIRYSEAELTTLAQDPAVDLLCLRLRDRFGDYGIIAVCISRQTSDVLSIESWIMSCRVLGRGVEELTVALLADAARRRGCRRLVGHFIPSAKNALVSDLYPRLGFTPIADREEGRQYVCDADSVNMPKRPIRLKVR
jgi:FkbH-like protein